MGRLTERTAAGVANINYSGCQFEDGERDKIAESARRQNAIESLAAIEDILGDTYDLDHLRELVEADKDGRCVVLPYKVGDKAYWIVDGGVFECYFNIGAAGEVGKTVFLTREAAEAALAKEAADGKR